MGKIEKSIVLTVLFVSAIVLAISLNEDAAEVDAAASPLEAAQARLRGESQPAPPPAVESPAAERDERDSRSAADLLLNTEVAREPVAEAPEDDRVEGDALPRILRDEKGLGESGLDDYRVYEVRDGDTWAGLCQRFYGDLRHVHQLRSANEEIEDLGAGERILVPVYDFADEAGRRRPFAPLNREDRSEGEVAAEVAKVEKKPASKAIAVPGTYEVKDGDNLSKISKAVYGKASRWEDIYAANRDKLDSPDWLEVGMKLTIPK